MHLLIPFAASSDRACRQALTRLQLPQLARVLAQLQPGPLQHCPPQTLEVAHEAALAHTLGLPSPAPWAALAAQRLGLARGGQTWAYVTPCYWEIGQAQVTLHDPQQLQLQDEEARALLAAVQPYFIEDGLSLHWESAGRWLACGEPLRGLLGASPERAIGRNVAPWLPASPLLRRLQNEMQMLLYTHPVNDARSSQRQTPVNSFWFSGFGSLPAHTPTAANPPWMPMSLRDSALQADWPAWGAAWQALDQDQGPALLAALQQGQAVQLTLCGDSCWQSWSSAGQASLLRRWLARWRQPDANSFLKPLCN